MMMCVLVMTLMYADDVNELLALSDADMDTQAAPAPAQMTIIPTDLRTLTEETFVVWPSTSHVWTCR